MLIPKSIYITLDHSISVLGICHLLAPAPGSGLSNSWLRLRLRAPGFKNLGSGSGSGLRPFKILAPAPAPAPEPAIFGAAPCWLRAPGGKSMNYFSLGDLGR